MVSVLWKIKAKHKEIVKLVKLGGGDSSFWLSPQVICVLSIISHPAIRGLLCCRWVSLSLVCIGEETQLIPAST